MKRGLLSTLILFFLAGTAIAQEEYRIDFGTVIPAPHPWNVAEPHTPLSFLIDYKTSAISPVTVTFDYWNYELESEWIGGTVGWIDNAAAIDQFVCTESLGRIVVTNLQSSSYTVKLLVTVRPPHGGLTKVTCNWVEGAGCLGAPSSDVWSPLVNGHEQQQWIVWHDVVPTGTQIYIHVTNLSCPVATANALCIVADASLSVDLHSFSAHQQGATVKLNWVTESETDNAGFILERANGHSPLEWQPIASYTTHAALSGQGNTSEQTEYSFVDETAECSETYCYRLSDANTQGNVTVQDLLSITLDAAPEATVLKPAYPNPFNPSTKIQYELAENSSVTLKVVDILGRHVQTLVPGENKSAGSYSVHWNSRSDQGLDVPSGVYFLVMQAGAIVKTQKVMLVR